MTEQLSAAHRPKIRGLYSLAPWYLVILSNYFLVLKYLQQFCLKKRNAACFFGLNINSTPTPEENSRKCLFPDEILHVFWGCSSNTQQTEIQPLLEMAPAPSLFLSSLLARITHTTLLCEAKAILGLCLYICCCRSVPKLCLTLCGPMDFTISEIRSNAYLSSQWCHPALSSSVILFSSCLQSFLASGFSDSSELALHIRWPKYWSFHIVNILNFVCHVSLCDNYSTLSLFYHSSRRQCKWVSVIVFQ